MIQANELRTGNYILLEGEIRQCGGITFTVDSLQGIRICSTWYEFKSIECITLTPEILEKCGSRDGGKSWKNKDEDICVFKTQSGTYELQIGTVDVFCIEIKYLHHFQNIIFALTGEEMNVEL